MYKQAKTEVADIIEKKGVRKDEWSNNNITCIYIY
jgi:hypothetical protein